MVLCACCSLETSVWNAYKYNSPKACILFLLVKPSVTTLCPPNTIPETWIEALSIQMGTMIKTLY